LNVHQLVEDIHEDNHREDQEDRIAKAVFPAVERCATEESEGNRIEGHPGVDDRHLFFYYFRRLNDPMGLVNGMICS